MGKFREKIAAKKDEAWLAWLSDDPPPAEMTQIHTRTPPVSPEERLRYAGTYQRQPAQPAVTIAPTTVEVAQPASSTTPALVAPKNTNKAPVTIQISIHKPSLPKLPPKVAKRFSAIRVKFTKINRKQLILGGSTLSLVLLLAIGGLIASHKQGKIDSQGHVAGATTDSRPTINSGITPSFKPIYPLNKPELATIDDPSKAVYDEKRKVFSFADTINANPVTVSQQEEPDNIRKDPDGLKNLAKNMNASTPLDTHWGKAYLATNPKTQGQTVVFVANGLLIFAQTSFSHDNNAWKSYINDLSF